MDQDQIIQALGVPYYQAADCLIYNLDCIEAMARLPSGFVSLTVTSPPYNIGKDYERPLPLDEYLAWCRRWLAEVYRLTTDTGAFWLNLGYLELPGRARALPLPYLLWNEVPFYLIQEVVWHYGAGVAGRRFLSPRNEKLLWYVKDSQRYLFNLDAIRDPAVKYPHQKKHGKLKCNQAGKNPGDVWIVPKVTSGRKRSSPERTPHPAQSPLAVVERILRCSSESGAVVLDPFLGSGTTALAAISLGRSALGFELRPDYCAIAAQRIEAYLQSLEKEATRGGVYSTDTDGADDGAVGR